MTFSQFKNRASAGLQRTQSFLSGWGFPGLLLLVCALVFGARGVSLGFFWDDWPNVWFIHRLGPAGVQAAFASDRPFLGATYFITATLLNDSPLAWQLFGVAARWLAALAFWWVLRSLWPRQTSLAAAAALLFAVYPGFTQQWISVIYGHAWLIFAAQLASLAVMLAAARAARWPARLGWTALGLALCLYALFSTEYFFGLELLRPLLLWVALQPLADPRDPKRPVARALLHWLPYLAAMIFFVVWRMVLHPFPGHDIGLFAQILRDPLRTLSRLAGTIIEDLAIVSFESWSQAFRFQGLFDDGFSAGARTLVEITLVFALSLLALYAPRAQSEQRPPAISVWTGLAGILVAGAPFWLAGLPIVMGFPWDRYALPFSVGVALALAALAGRWLRSSLAQAVTLALVIAVSAGFQFNQALDYRVEWNNTRSFFWQLVWRAPGLQPGTTLITDHPSFLLNEDDSLTAPLNWTYDPDGQGEDMPYLLFNFSERFRGLKSGQVVEKDYRATRFESDADHLLFFDYEPPACLHILDPQLHGELYTLSAPLQRWMGFSNLDLIQPNPAQPAAPPDFFDPYNPQDTWCYYYQKADLARQNGDWETIAQLRDESIARGLRPLDPLEYLPFIQAFIQLGRTGDALELTTRAYEDNPDLRPVLLKLWGDQPEIQELLGNR